LFVLVDLFKHAAMLLSTRTPNRPVSQLAGTVQSLPHRWP
jgi:hypothetical protein